MIRSGSLKTSSPRRTPAGISAVLLVAAFAFVPVAPVIGAAVGADAASRTNPVFLRGDANQDGEVDLADAVSILACIYLGGSCSECRDSLDVNDDGSLDISDPVSLLGWSFLGGAVPRAPGPSRCGLDPTPDSLPECAYDRSACAGGSPPSVPARFTVSGVEPREVEESQGPLSIAITGSGFEKGVFVRLYYPDEGALSMDVKPKSVSSDRVVFSVGADWLGSLSVAGPAAAGPRKPEGFFVKVVHPDGSSSEPGVVLIRRFALRLNQVTAKPLVLGDWTNAVDIALEWRTWAEPVQVELAAFEAPPEDENAAEPQAFRLGRIPGILGADLLKPGTEITSIPVSVAADVLPGTYLLQVVVKSIASADAALPAQPLSVNMTRVTVVEAAAVKGIVKKKGPPIPGPQPPPPGPHLPMPPSLLHINLHVVEETDNYIVLRWKYPPDSTKHWLERKVSSGWNYVASFDESDAVDEWITYRHDLNQQKACSACYRIVAENDYGRGEGLEACVQKDPYLGEVDPPILDAVYIYTWGVQLKWYAYAPAEGETRFEFISTDPDWGNYVRDSVPFAPAPGQWGFYVWNAPWSAISTRFNSVPPKLCMRIGITNRCSVSFFGSNEICFQTQVQSPGNPPHNPPPSTPKADLGFPYGIYLGDYSNYYNDIGWAKAGQAVKVCWGVANYGTADTGTFTDTLFVDGGNAWPVQYTNVGWPGWSDLEYRSYPNGFTAGNHSLEVRLDALNQVSEVTEGNNYHYRGILVGK